MTRIVLFLAIFTSLANIPSAIALSPGQQHDPKHSYSIPTPSTSTPSHRPAAFPGIANIPGRQPLPRPPHSPDSPHFPARHNFPFPTTALSNETATSSVRPVAITGVTDLPGPLQPSMPPHVPIILVLPSTTPSPPRLQDQSPETDAHLKIMSPTKTTASTKTSASYGETASPRTAPLSRTAVPRSTTLSSRKPARLRKIERMTTSSTKTTVSTRMLNKRRNLKKFVKALEGECDFDLLDEVHKDLKDLWVEVKEERSNRNQSEMDDLQQLLKNLLGQYDNCTEDRLILDPDRQWEIYLKIFGKEYNEKEKEIRRAIFKTSMDDIIKHKELYRNGLTSYSTNLNRFSDWTEEELEKLNGFKPSNATLHGRTKRMDRSSEGPIRTTYDYNPNDVLPISFTWGRNYVTPVRDQGECGSCYAFAGNGALEAYHKKQTGELVELSVQNILDCTWHLGNDGCDGGEQYTVFDYARTNGVVAKNWYLYTMNASHNCRWKREHVAATDSGYYVIPRESEGALQHAVSKLGPVAVGIGTKDIHRYRSGVFCSSDCGPVSHAVLVVGYGSDLWGGDYWIVKNCWGPDWGEHGYIRISRNRRNMCHVASDAFLPF